MRSFVESCSHDERLCEVFFNLLSLSQSSPQEMQRCVDSCPSSDQRTLVQHRLAGIAHLSVTGRVSPRALNSANIVVSFKETNGVAAHITVIESHGDNAVLSKGRSDARMHAQSRSCRFRSRAMW